jgi:hypothetical protein
MEEVWLGAGVDRAQLIDLLQHHLNAFHWEARLVLAKLPWSSTARDYIKTSFFLICWEEYTRPLQPRLQIPASSYIPAAQAVPDSVSSPCLEHVGPCISYRHRMPASPLNSCSLRWTSLLSLWPLSQKGILASHCNDWCRDLSGYLCLSTKNLSPPQ